MSNFHCRHSSAFALMFWLIGKRLQGAGHGPPAYMLWGLCVRLRSGCPEVYALRSGGGGHAVFWPSAPLLKLIALAAGLWQRRCWCSGCWVGGAYAGLRHADVFEHDRGRGEHHVTAKVRVELVFRPAHWRLGVQWRRAGAAAGWTRWT